MNIDERRAEWIKARHTGLGGSDIAPMLGLVPQWKSPFALWAEKTGLAENDAALDELEYIEWGNVLEEPIAKKYQKVTGRDLFDPGRFSIIRHPSIPFMHCTIDRKITPIDDRGEGILEIKNVGLQKAADWETEPPLNYQVQLQHQLAVTGAAWGSFAVLIGGQKFIWLDVPRDEKLIAYLIEKETEFWAMVESETPPEVDTSYATAQALERMYPKDTGESVDLPAEFTALRDQRNELRAQIKDAEQRIQLIDNRIKDAMRTASVGLLPDGSGFSWKTQQRKEFTVKASEFRVLREIKAGKGKQ